MRAGRVGRPHGLDGSFYVVDPVARLLVPGAEAEGLGRIAAVKGAAAKPIVRLDGAASREDAEAVRGRPLEIADAAPPPLGEDEFLAADLEGCVVVADGTRELGTVARLLAYPSCEVLELSDGSLVPLVRDCVRAVDVAAKRIDVDGGFLGAA